jgi:putative ABC transport system permease protein
VIYLAIRELVSRRTATALAAVGLLTANLGFIVLTSTSQTTEAVLKGDISRAWQAPYDLLVRPPTSETALERSQALVRPNFLATVAGGITQHQLDLVRHVPGIEVAAPIAMIGIYEWPDPVPIDVSSTVHAGDAIDVYRMHITASADGGLSNIPFQDTTYDVAAPQGSLDETNHFPTARFTRTLTVPDLGTVTCNSIGDSEAPFCWGPHEDCSPCFVDQPTWFRYDFPGFQASLSEPMMVAAVDPVAEAQLAGLDRCVSKGHYLTAGPVDTTNQVGRLPVLISSRSFIDETFHIEVDQATDVASIARGLQPSQLSSWVPVLSRNVTAAQAYEGVLSGTVGDSAATLFIRPGDISYSVGGAGHLNAQTQPQDLTVYVDPYHGRFAPAPDEARDTWVRSAGRITWNNALSTNSHFALPEWQTVGQYDPRCVPGFNSIAGGQMGTYAAPDVTLSNGRALGSTRSVGGYVSSPPLLLTTLDAARFIADPVQYTGGPGQQFISAIRIRVRDVATAGPIAQARLSRIAAEVRATTGLAVDIVRGSSPLPVKVDLPPGHFGRPALTVEDLWSAKGVSFRFLQAVSKQNLAMFVVILIAAATLVGETAYVSIRRRRPEFGVLRAVGWSRREVGLLVEIEMVLVGLLSGLASVIIGVPVLAALGHPTSWPLLIAAPPLATTVAALAALIPATSAARGTTVSVLAGSGRVRASRLPRSPLGLGFREIRSQWYPESFLGVLAIGLGTALFGSIVLVAAGFSGQLDTSLLGIYLAGEVRPFHLVLASLTLVIGALAAGEIVALNYLDRRVNLAMLRSVGWSRSEVLQVLAGQALALGAMGGLVGTLTVLMASAILSAPAGAVAFGVAAALVMAGLAAGIAVAVPLRLAYRLEPTVILKGE